MGVNDPILLLSPLPSPIASTPHLPKANVGLSSSPDLPSASQVLAKRKEHTVSGSGAKRAPEETVVGFTTAASLLNNDCKSTPERTRPIGHYTAIEIGRPPRDSLAHAESGEGKVGQKHGSSKKLKVTTMRETISQEKVDVGAKVPQNPESPARKRCGKKSTENGQMKINKTKVTKPRSTAKPSNSSKKISAFKALLGDGEDFSRILEEQDSKRGEPEENLNLCLDEAIRRRQSWTPIKDTPKERSCSEDTEPAITCSLSSSDTTDAPIPLTSGFGNILGRFGIENHVALKSARPTPSRSLSGEALTKKRKLEVSPFPGSLTQAESRIARLEGSYSTSLTCFIKEN